MLGRFFENFQSRVIGMENIKIGNAAFLLIYRLHARPPNFFDGKSDLLAPLFV